jgi:hypothetical protein
MIASIDGRAAARKDSGGGKIRASHHIRTGWQTAPLFDPSQTGLSERGPHLGKVPATGFEPVTFGLGNQRSIQLSYAGDGLPTVSAFLAGGKVTSKYGRVRRSGKQEAR